MIRAAPSPATTQATALPGLAELPGQIFLSRGRYRARISRDADEIAAARSLRSVAFRMNGRDLDQFDGQCDHLLIRDAHSGTPVCCARFLVFPQGAGVADSYSAQFYDLTSLSGFAGVLAEMGRFCIHPDWTDPDILRVAWAAMTGYVDENYITMLFGCSSFAGTDCTAFADTFALLKQRHLAPARWMARKKAPEVICFAAGETLEPDTRRALQAMPPLLRSYLMMGAWVGDHAVVDRRMNTLHVFTGLEIATIPAGRKRLLRMMGG